MVNQGYKRNYDEMQREDETIAVVPSQFHQQYSPPHSPHNDSLTQSTDKGVCVDVDDNIIPE